MNCKTSYIMNHISEPKWDFRDDFITVIDNALSHDFCDELIWTFEKMHEIGYSYTRKDQNNEEPFDMKDTSVNIGDISMPKTWDIFKKTTGFLEKHFDVYFDKYATRGNFTISGIKLQKTLPSEGYHVWHADGGGETQDRLLTFVYYLNDVEEGGDTEFLNQKTKIYPKKGSAVWFPACYTHIHRGNPPISNEKYIMTGWLSYD